MLLAFYNKLDQCISNEKREQKVTENVQDLYKQ